MATDERQQCGKCGGPMEEGFAMSGPLNGQARVPEEWVEGQPEWSMWTGTKTKGRDRHRIVSYRCERCGYLESYAR